MKYRMSYVGHAILLALILSTIAYYVLQPHNLYEPNSILNFTRIKDGSFHRYFFSEKDDFFFITKSNLGNLQIRISNANLEKSSYTELGHLSNLKTYQEECYYDAINKRIYTLEIGHDLNYYLLEYNIETKEYQSIPVFQHPAIETVEDRFIEINGNRFFGFTTSDTIAVKKEKDVVLGFTDSLKYHINQGDYDHEMIHDYLSKLRKTGINLKTVELAKIKNFFNRNNYFGFDKSYFHKVRPIYPKLVGYLKETNEVVYSLQANRYISNILIAIDLETKQISWQRQYLGSSKQSFIITLKNKKQKIVVATYAPCYEQPYDFLENEKEYIGTTRRPQLLVFDPDGKQTTINGLQLRQEGKVGFNGYAMYWDNTTNELYFYLDRNKNEHPAYLQVLNFTTGQVKTTNVMYDEIILLTKCNDGFMFIGQEDKSKKAVYLDRNLNIKKEIDLPFLNRLHPRVESFKVTILGKEYYLFNAGLLISTDWKTKIKLPQDYRHIVKVKDKYFCTYHGTGSRPFFELTEAISNPKIKLQVIILFLVELILYLLFLIIDFIFRTPNFEVHHNFLVHYNILKIIHLYSLKGTINHYHKLPKKMSILTDNTALFLVHLNTKNELVLEKDYGFAKQEIFNLGMFDFLPMIQRISHDIKNKLMILKMASSSIQDDLYMIDKIPSTVSETTDLMKQELDNITEMAKNLTNLSRLPTYNVEEINLVDLVTLVMQRYILHPNFYKLESKLEAEDCFIQVDYNLMQAALINLLDNAFDAVSGEGKIWCNTYKIKEHIFINIKNTGFIDEKIANKIFDQGFTTKESGSGLGLPISKMIITKFNGDLSLDINDDVISFIIKFKRV